MAHHFCCQGHIHFVLSLVLPASRFAELSIDSTLHAPSATTRMPLPRLPSQIRFCCLFGSHGQLFFCHDCLFSGILLDGPSALRHNETTMLKKMLDQSVELIKQAPPQFLSRREGFSALEEELEDSLAGLKCERYGGPMEASAVAEMMYWQDIPANSQQVSPLKRQQQQSGADCICGGIFNVQT